MSKSDILRLFISNAYTLEKQWFFSLTLNECPASKIYIYLKVGHTGMNGEGEKSSFSWFTPPVAITARAGPRCIQQPEASARSLKQVQGIKDLCVRGGCLPLLFTAILWVLDRRGAAESGISTHTGVAGSNIIIYATATAP